MSIQQVKSILFGAAYYDEYVPQDLDRIDEDMVMMKQAGMNVIRIAESTWSTEEPQPGVFDFTHVDRALDAAERAGINVIVGTPTYAVPAWLVRMHPDVLADTPQGAGKYGARQIMDIVNPAYRFYGERIIRKLISHVAQHPAVIGYQVDNETKYYDSVSRDMQALFVKSLRERFDNNLQALNEAFGLDYWSNRIDAWEDFPDVTGSINQSLRGAFDRFRRQQVSEFLAWQAGIVREYMRDDQFITHNFDFDWRGYSYGVQPMVDHFEASQAMDMTGADIYHPTEDELTGKEIAFGGDLARSTKEGRNYIVLETEAQGQHGWLPFPGQLRLQAYSHLASGADGVMYWHWSSIHNSFETYWKGVLSHDYEPNPTYREAGVFGNEIAQDHVQRAVRHLRKHNRVAIMVNNESLSALDWFRIETGFPFGGGVAYNDVVRRVYDALFELNVECDIVPSSASAQRLAQYSMVIVPALYCAPQSTVDVLREFVANGGHLLATMRSFVSDEDVKVWHDRAPHALDDVFGIRYNQFTRPRSVDVRFTAEYAGSTVDTKNDAAVDAAQHGGNSVVEAQALIELLTPAQDTTVLAYYDHYAWRDYAAITRHTFGKGDAQWIGTLLDSDAMREVLREAVTHAAVLDQAIAALHGAVTVRQGINEQGQHVTYLLNYSAQPVTFAVPVSGEVLVGGVRVVTEGTAIADEAAGPAAGSVLTAGDCITLGPWNLAIVVSE